MLEKKLILFVSFFIAPAISITASAQDYLPKDEIALQPLHYAFSLSPDENPDLAGLYEVQSFSATENYAGFRLSEETLKEKTIKSFYGHHNWLCFPLTGLPEEAEQGLRPYSTLIFPLNRLNLKYNASSKNLPIPIPIPLPFLVSGSAAIHNSDLRYAVTQEFERGAETVYISFDWSDNMEQMAGEKYLKNFMPFFRPCDKL